MINTHNSSLTGLLIEISNRCTILVHSVAMTETVILFAFIVFDLSTSSVLCPMNKSTVQRVGQLSKTGISCFCSHSTILPLLAYPVGLNLITTPGSYFFISHRTSGPRLLPQ